MASAPLAPGQSPLDPLEMRAVLHRMLGVLESERQALAGLDVDAIIGCTVQKHALCDQLESADAQAVDAECRGLVDAARRLNETNRRVRNLIAANVAARLDALTGQPAIYRAEAAPGRVSRLR